MSLVRAGGTVDEEEVLLAGGGCVGEKEGGLDGVLEDTSLIRTLVQSTN